MDKNSIPKRYEFLQLIDESFNSTVIKVKDTISDEIKVLKIVSEKSPFYQGIYDEYKFIKENEHPNLIEIYGCGYLPDRSYFYEMPYYDKIDPLAYCKREKEKGFLTIFWQILNGLNFLHERGKVHGDISMDNIFVIKSQDGVIVKISDFGLSSLIVAQNISQISGTAYYMAPELLSKSKNATLTPQADLYSLGIYLYTIFSGEKLFASSNPMEVMKEKLIKKSFDIKPIFDVDKNILSIVKKLMSKEPELRYQSCNDVLKELYPYLVKYKIDVFHENYIIKVQNIHLFRNDKIDNIIDSIIQNQISIMHENETINFANCIDSLKTKFTFIRKLVITMKNDSISDFSKEIDELILKDLPSNFKLTPKSKNDIDFILFVSAEVWNNNLDAIDALLERNENRRLVIIKSKNNVIKKHPSEKMNSIKVPILTVKEFEQYFDKIFGNNVLPEQLKTFFKNNCNRDIKLLSFFLNIAQKEEVFKREKFDWEFDTSKVENIKLPNDIIKNYLGNHNNFSPKEKQFISQLAFWKRSFLQKEISDILGYKTIHIQDYIKKMKKEGLISQPSKKMQFRYEFVKNYLKKNTDERMANSIKTLIINYLFKKSSFEYSDFYFLFKYLKETKQYQLMMDSYNKYLTAIVKLKESHIEILELFFAIIEELKKIDSKESANILHKYVKAVRISHNLQKDKEAHIFFQNFVSNCDNKRIKELALSENFEWFNIISAEQEKVTLFEENKDTIGNMSPELKYDIYYGVLRAYSALGQMPQAMELGEMVLENSDIQLLVRIRLLFQIANIYTVLNLFDKYHSTIIMAKELAEKIKFHRGIVYGNLLLALREFENFRNTEGMKYLKKALSLNQSSKTFDFTINFAYYRYYSNMGRYNKALNILIKDKKDKLVSNKGSFHYFQLSEILMGVGYYKQALSHINKAISLVSDDSTFLPTFLMTKFQISLSLKDKTYLDEAEKLFEQHKSGAYLSDIFTNQLLFVEAYIKYNEIEKTTIKYNELIEEYPKNQKTMGNEIGFRKLQAMYMFKTDNLPSAIKFIKKAITLAESVKNEFSESYEIYYYAYLITKKAFKKKYTTEDYKQYLNTAYKIVKKRLGYLPNNKMKRTYQNKEIVARIIDTYENEIINSKISGMEPILLNVLEEISQIISNVSEKKKLFSELLKIVLRVTKADRGIIITIDNKTMEQKVEYAYQIDADSLGDITSVNRDLVEKVFKKKKAVFNTKVASNDVFDPYQSFVNLKVESIVCLPLIVHKQILGTIYLDSKSLLAFTPEEIKFLNILSQVAASAVETSQNYSLLQLNNLKLAEMLNKDNITHEKIVGNSSQIQEVFKKIEQVAPTDVNVLIEGESGTGKELIARDIHKLSRRSNKKYIPVDCGSLSENIIESELFGHKKGAFTGAVTDKRGLFEEANGGTIFLDEISNLSIRTQNKLLRLIQEGEFKKVGENSVRKVDVRLIVASNIALKKLVSEGKFRQDLYYRLSIFPIDLPPLRKRNGDIKVLSQHFLAYYNSIHQKNIKGFTGDALKILENYDWPGNIRQLQNEIERSVIVCNGIWLGKENYFHLEATNNKIHHATQKDVDFNKMIDAYKVILIKKALKENNNNWSKAAQSLNLTRQSMRRIFKRIVENSE